MNDDLISRQKAIDVLSVGKELLSRVLDDIDVVGADREKYSWGLGLIESNIEDIKELPSAQPESCEDTVSRQRLLNDLKELITAWKKYPVMAKQIKGVEAAIEYVKAIPSADRPKGEWVFDTQIPISGGGSSAGYRCSICGRDYFHVDGMNFCPNCGSYNGGESDDKG